MAETRLGAGIRLSTSNYPYRPVADTDGTWERSFVGPTGKSTADVRGAGINFPRWQPPVQLERSADITNQIHRDCHLPLSDGGRRDLINHHFRHGLHDLHLLGHHMMLRAHAGRHGFHAFHIGHSSDHRFRSVLQGLHVLPRYSALHRAQAR
jgi:hypothetical protein